MDRIKDFKELNRKFLIVAIFSIAMGFLEGAVVVYLRELYYPNGFSFPLSPIPPLVATTEFFREVATIIMLAGIGIMAGNNKLTRFSWFMFSFAIWDIVYYAALKVILDWPSSLLTWDILFLIPVPWVGPVIAPLIISGMMLFVSVIIINKDQHNSSFNTSRMDSAIGLTGCFIVLYSFMEDYLKMLQSQGWLKSFWMPGSKEALFDMLNAYIPHSFNWTFFVTGCVLISIFIFKIVGNVRRA